MAGCAAGGVIGDRLGDAITRYLSEASDRERGLPPDGVAPPVEGECEIGPASRPSEGAKGGKSLWDPEGGEWRYYPEDKWHNPHWDYNPHDSWNSPWNNVPIGGLPPRKGGV